MGRFAAGPGARLADRDDLLVDLAVVTGEEGAPVDHHVDLVGAVGDGLAGVGELGFQGCPPGGEGGGHRRHGHRAAAQGVHGHGHEIGVDADGGHLRDVTVLRVGPTGLRGQGAYLPGGVGSLQRGQVDHPDGQVDGVCLGGGLDRAGGQSGGAGTGAHLVDAREAVQEGAQRGVVGGAGQPGSGVRHGRLASPSAC